MYKIPIDSIALDSKNKSKMCYKYFLKLKLEQNVDDSGTNYIFMNEVAHLGNDLYIYKQKRKDIINFWVQTGYLFIEEDKIIFNDIKSDFVELTKDEIEYCLDNFSEKSCRLYIYLRGQDIGQEFDIKSLGENALGYSKTRYGNTNYNKTIKKCLDDMQNKNILKIKPINKKKYDKRFSNSFWKLAYIGLADCNTFDDSFELENQCFENYQDIDMDSLTFSSYPSDGLNFTDEPKEENIVSSTPTVFDEDERYVLEWFQDDDVEHCGGYMWYYFPLVFNDINRLYGRDEGYCIIDSSTSIETFKYYIDSVPSMKGLRFWWQQLCDFNGDDNAKDYIISFGRFLHNCLACSEYENVKLNNALVGTDGVAFEDASMQWLLRYNWRYEDKPYYRSDDKDMFPYFPGQYDILYSGKYDKYQRTF